MKRLVALYGTILRPWLCVLIYLWLLELQAAYRFGFESYSDSIADASAILWTVIFWIAITGWALVLVAILWSRPSLIRVNEFVCRASCVLITAFYLRHWLHALWPEHAKHKLIIWLLMIPVALAYWLVRRRRIRSANPQTSILPSWKDCFSFAVWPLLVMTALTLAI